MRLTRKLIVAIGLGICLVLGVHAWLRVVDDGRRYEDDIRRDHRVLSRALATAVELLGTSGGDQRAQEVVEAVNRRESHVEVRWERGSTVARAGSAVVARDGQRVLVTTRPIVVSGRPAGVIRLLESLEPEAEVARATAARAVVTMLALLSVSVLVLAVFGVWFVGRPLRLLTARAAAIGRGDLEQRLHLTQHDEIRDLADEMNAMCARLVDARDAIARETAARLAAVEQLRHADRLHAVGELASGIAHELGTPLNVVRARAQMIARGEIPDDRTGKIAEVIVEQCDRMTTIIGQLLSFARRDPLRLDRVDAERWLESVAQLVDPIARQRGIKLEIERGAGPFEVSADPVQLRHAMTNLVLNAIQAAPEASIVRLGLSLDDLQPPLEHGGPRAVYVTLFVVDRGPGIAPEHARRIFEPFFTTKPPGQGTGLGLPIARDIVQQHGGWVSVGGTPDLGTRVSIHLPRLAPARAEAP